MENEKRLIDANALLENLGEEPMVWSDGETEIQERNDWRRFKACVEAQDTVDAVEVVHGRWTYDAVQACGLFDDSLPVWVDVMQCSVCNEYIEGSHGTRYCPNCGAKMDGGRRIE